MKGLSICKRRSSCGYASILGPLRSADYGDLCRDQKSEMRTVRKTKDVVRARVAQTVIPGRETWKLAQGVNKLVLPCEWTAAVWQHGI